MARSIFTKRKFPFHLIEIKKKKEKTKTTHYTSFPVFLSLLFVFSGTTCNTPVNPCSPNPCRNNGVCLVSNGQATCECTSTFTGSRCETQRQACGGVSRNPVGVLQFPMGGSTYQHGLSCAWVLITEPSKVLNVTFTSFHLEQSTDCKFDFLQV